MSTRSRYATNFKHGESGTELYGRWAQMNGRCYLPSYINFPKYGGKGVSVCDEWRHDYIRFRDWAMANGWKPGLSLDRKDNSLGYSPSNCRWVTVLEQQANRRKRRSPVRRGHEGVERLNSRWRAYTFISGRKKHLGVFDTPEEAAAVSAKARME